MYNLVISVVIICSTILINNSVSGQSISTRVLTLSGNTTEELSIYDHYQNPLQDSIRFISVAVHCQKHNLTLFKANRTHNESVTGHNIGLVLVTNDDIGLVYIVNNHSRDVNTLLVVTYHKNNDPIPGGCNEEFPLEISPFLRLYNNEYVNRLDFQLANIDPPEGYHPINCEKSQLLIKYDIYAYYLQENDFTEEEYFRAVIVMSNVTDVQRSATLVHNTTTTRSYFYSYPRRGVVYTIIASSQGFSSAYVPIVSYECTDFGDCGHHNVMSLSLIVFYGIIGFWVCLKGHTYFRTQLLFFGLIDGSFLSYLLLAKYTGMTQTEIAGYSLLGGIGMAAIWLMVWRTFLIPVVSLTLSGLSLGLLVIATILFTNLGNLELFYNDMNYWLITSCSALLVTLFFMMLNAVVLSVVSTSIVGAYVTVVAFDRFVDGSLSFIILNVVKRAVVPSMVMNAVPFQNKDTILSVLWILLSLTGIVLQLYDARDRTRAPFPGSSTCSPRRTRYTTRRVGYDTITRDPDVTTRQRSQRWNPIPTAANQPRLPTDNTANDERSSLLYPNFNIYGPRPATPPPDYNHITNANRRDYQYID